MTRASVRLEYLCHVTPVQNLHDILTDWCLYPLRELHAKGRQPVWPLARHSQDGYVSLSVQYPNSNLYRDRYGYCGLEPIALLFGINVLGSDSLLFCQANAAASGAEPMQGVSGWHAMFADSALGSRQRPEWRRDWYYPTNCTTNPQAEILVPGPISLDLCNRLVISSDEGWEIAKAALAGFVTATKHWEPRKIPRWFEPNLLPDVKRGKYIPQYRPGEGPAR